MTGCQVMAKPASSRCNLNCRYCFYIEKPEQPMMDDTTLERFISQHIAAQPGPGPEVSFAWQGGEPTLCGLAFFQRALALQRQYANGKKIHNAFQTNGLLLNDDWCRFFRENGWLVGISLDGPADLHDAWRVNRSGKPTHHKVIKAIETLTIVGSFFVILLNIPIKGYMDFIAPWRDILDVPFRFTVAGDAISGRYIPVASLSSQGLFGAIISSLIAIEIYRFIKVRNIEIKMPTGVPPVVASSFSALFPTLAVVLIFWVPRHFLNIDINAIISYIIMPLKGFMTGTNLFGGIVTQFFIDLFWVFGIHGHAVMGPLIRPLWDQAIVQNMELFQAGTSAYDLPNIFIEQFFQWYAQMGGTGSTLALVVLFIRSKVIYLKSLGKLSFIPGLFNINEPMIFGAPIVMNPILAVPFILAPMVNTVVVYLCTISGLIPRMMVKPPFTIPAPLGALITTNWNLIACGLVFICFFISLAIYYPFFKVYEKKMLETQQAQQEEEEKAKLLADA